MTPAAHAPRPARSAIAALSWITLAVVIALGVRVVLAVVPARVAALPHGPSARPRIVSLVGGVTETLITLGAQDCIVNQSWLMTSRDAAGKPHIYASERSGMTNAESILALHPDYVFVARELMHCLEGRGLDVVMVPQDSFPAMRSFVMQLGRDLGNEAGARAALDHMDAKMAEIRSRVAGLPRVRVYYEEGLPGRTRGPGTAIDEMIRLAGGENIYDDASIPRPTISLETIVAADPQVMLVPYDVTPESVRQRQGWENVSAVRTGRIHPIPRAERAVGLFSPSCADCCERTLLRWLHPELFDGEGDD